MPRTGRPPKGPDAKRKVVSARLTAHQWSWLVMRWGSPSRGVQHLVREAIAKEEGEG